MSDNSQLKVKISKDFWQELDIVELKTCSTYLGEAPNSVPGLQAKAPKARFIPFSPFKAGNWLRIWSGAAFIESLKDDVKINMAHVGRSVANFYVLAQKPEKTNKNQLWSNSKSIVPKLFDIFIVQASYMWNDNRKFRLNASTFDLCPLQAF